MAAVGNFGLLLVSFFLGPLVSLKTGDIINHELVASSYRNREFLSYVRILVVLTVPSLLWLVLIIVTIPARQQIRKQIRLYTGIGVAISMLAGVLFAVFVDLVRYV